LDSGETLTDRDLLRGRFAYTFHFLAQVQAVTLIALGRGYAVRAKEHFGARVLTALARFTQCAGYAVDTGTPFYFCHDSLNFKH
jgi:hypothetical protein